jgi:hypothetical protein
VCECAIIAGKACGGCAKSARAVEDAFVHEEKIDAQSYTAQRDKLREQIALAELELSEARIEQFDVEGILSFAEYVLTNAARMWMELDLDRKQQLRQVLFPKGLSFDGDRFGTAVTCFALKLLEENGASKSGMASPTGYEEGRQLGPVTFVGGVAARVILLFR